MHVLSDLLVSPVALRSQAEGCGGNLFEADTMLLFDMADFWQPASSNPEHLARETFWRYSLALKEPTLA